MIHHGYTYSEGLNVDHIPFNPNGECAGGGLYFCEVKDVYRYFSYGSLLAEVEIPSNALVYQEKNKLKADKLILKNIAPIAGHSLWSDPDICKIIATRHGSVLQYAATQNINAHRYAKEPIYATSVNKNGLTLLQTAMIKPYYRH
jgi:hypothetical protein